MDPELIKLLVGSGVGSAVAAYLLFKTIPDLTKAFREETTDQRKTFADEVNKSRESHAAELRSLHQTMHSRDEKLIQALSDIQDRRRDER